MLRVITGDRHDPSYKQRLNDLIQRVFGFSFSKWDTAGFWNENYRPYSLTDGEKLVANVSVSITKLLLGGKPQTAIQIGAVATLPEYRGQGLARQLLEHVLDLYRGVPALLSANRSVLDFYPRFGFKPVNEIQPTIQLASPITATACERLTAGDPRLLQRLQARRHFSQIIDVADSTSISMFHLLMGFGDSIYYLREQDAVVIAQQEENTVVIYDLLLGSKGAVDTLLTSLPFPGVTTVQFAFCPDWLGIHYQEQPFIRQDDWGYLFARGIDLGPHCKFPQLCVT